MITITPPKKFNFSQTASMLQRGQYDPINRFEEGKWNW